jgi:glycosyltransferase involved in cell wall biosynthesis
MFKLIFFLSISLLLYVYLGYPLFAYLWAKWRRDCVNKGELEPTVSILIAAYNEEKSIAETICNKLELDYPAEKLEIIIVSDGSTDQTDFIVQKFTEKNIRLLRQEPRAGKTSALNMAVPLAKGEIIVFSDANSLYDPLVIRKLVANFADRRVGYVSGKMIYTNSDGSFIGDGCSAYMKYENFLRSVETDMGSIVGVDGGIDAMRKDLYCPLTADQLPDFVQPLKVVEQGYRVIYEPMALLKEASLTKSVDEYRMRVRVTLRALWSLYDMRHLLFFRGNQLFSWQLWSHKLLRYLCFVFLITAFISNLMLLGSSWIYNFCFTFQCGVYITALFAPVIESSGFSSRVVVFIRYFVLLNLACAHSVGKLLLRQKQVIWTPRKG